MHARILILALGFGLWLSSAAASEPVQVVSEAWKGARQPRLALVGRETVQMVFGREKTVYHVRSDDGGKTFGEPVALGTVPQLALGMRRGPRVAAAGEKVVVTAISHEDGNLHTWISTNQGRSWKEGARLNEVAGCAREGLQDLAGDGQGNMMCVWLDLRGGKTELWGSVTRDGGEQWETNRVIYRSPSGPICECCHPTVSYRPGGEVMVMWRNSVEGLRDLYCARSQDGGRTFGQGQKLGKGRWELKACPMDGGNLAVGPGGEVASVWRREGAIYLAVPGQAEERVSEKGTQPVAVWGSSGVRVIWQTGSRLMQSVPPYGPKETGVMAEDAAYAVVETTVSGKGAGAEKRAMIAWESPGKQTLFVRRLDP